MQSSFVGRTVRRTGVEAQLDPRLRMRLTIDRWRRIIRTSGVRLRWRIARVLASAAIITGIGALV
jgi:hypothetical protein